MLEGETRGISEMHGVCEAWDQEAIRTVEDMAHYDGAIWELVYPESAEEGGVPSLSSFTRGCTRVHQAAGGREGN